MDENSFELTFDVVKDGHEDSQLLVEIVVKCFPVNLLLEEYQKQRYQNGACVFHKKNSCPANLWS